MAWRRRMPSALLIAAALCGVFALVSLALPSGLGYDQYAWLIWGRDLAHLDLSVTGTGTSWKPLPAVIDALLAPLGRNAVGGWLVIARAGALFAVFMAFRLAWRLSPRGTRWLAGAVAAASLILTQEWLRRTGVGNSEGLMVAFGLLAVDRHLDDHRGQAFALLVAGGMIRVEMWPFVGVYALWLIWRSHGWIRLAIALGAAAGPVLWFGGDWVGSGHLTTAADRALRPIPGSPGATAHPALAVAQEGFTMMPLPVWLAIGAGLVAAFVRRRRTPLVVLVGCAVGWTAVVAVMAAKGYGGLPRFVFMASALEAVAAGIGAALVAGAVANGNRFSRAAVAVATAAVFAVGSIPHVGQLPAEVAGIDKVADLDAALVRTVSTAGGPATVLRCGTPSTAWYTVTALAWDLGVPSSDVHDRPFGRRPVVFTPTGERWQLLEAGRCRLITAKAAQIRHRPPHHQDAHHRRNA